MEKEKINQFIMINGKFFPEIPCRYENKVVTLRPLGVPADLQSAVKN